MKKQNLKKVIALFSAMLLMASVSTMFVSADNSSALAPEPQTYIKMDEWYQDYPTVLFDRGNPGGFNIPITTNNSAIVRPKLYKDVFSYAYSPQLNYNYALGYGNYSLHLSNSFSVSVWFKAVQNSSVNQVIVADCPYSASPRWKIYIGTDNKVHFFWEKGTSDIDIAINRTDYFSSWRQVTFTFDGATLRGYMDGIELTSSTVSANDVYSNDRLMIGNDGGQESPFQGKLAGIKLYDGVVLTGEQILSEVLSVTPTIPASNPIPKTNLKFDENPIYNPGAFLDRGTPGGYNIGITTNDNSVIVRPAYSGEVFDYAYSPQKNYNYALGYGDYALHLSNSFSVLFIIKAVQKSAAVQVVAADCPYSTGSRWKISIGTDDKVHFTWGTSIDLAINKTEYFGKWTQIAFTYDGTTLTAYMNGMAENSIIIPTTEKFSAYSNDRLMVGNDINQESPFQGGIAELQMFDGVSITVATAAFKNQLFVEAVDYKDAQNRASTGDLNRNNTLDVCDLIEIKNILINKTEMDSNLLLISDYNKDNAVNLIDILYFKDALSGSTPA